MKVFSRNIKQYGFESMDVHKKTNLNFAKTKKVFNELTNKIAANSRSNQKTLTVVYFAGHGMM